MQLRILLLLTLIYRHPADISLAWTFPNRRDLDRVESYRETWEKVITTPGKRPRKRLETRENFSKLDAPTILELICLSVTKLWDHRAKSR